VARRWVRPSALWVFVGELVNRCESDKDLVPLLGLYHVPDHLDDGPQFPRILHDLDRPAWHASVHQLHHLELLYEGDRGRECLIHADDFCLGALYAARAHDDADPLLALVGSVPHPALVDQIH